MRDTLCRLLQFTSIVHLYSKVNEPKKKIFYFHLKRQRIEIPYIVHALRPCLRTVRIHDTARHSALTLCYFARIETPYIVDALHLCLCM